MLESASLTPLPATLACTCAFLTWGVWNGTVDYTSKAFRPGEKDVLFNVPYVAGSITPVAALNNLFNAAHLPGAVQQNFIATYNGGFVGNVQFGNSAYSANGTYSNTWNFGTRSGVVAGSFDGLGISGQTVAINNGPGFIGPLVVTAPAGGTFVGGGIINGAFFSSATSAVAGQAGNFAVAGQRSTGAGQPQLNYQAAGIFPAQK